MDTQVILEEAHLALRVEVGTIVRRLLAALSVGRLGSCCWWSSGSASGSVTSTRGS